MPTVTLNKDVFEKLVGKKLPLDKLKDRISMLGTDLEKIEGNEIHVEVFPDRPDMLSEQGFARAFSSFIGVKTGLRRYNVKKSGHKVFVGKGMEKILTPDQLTLLQKQKDLVKSQREAFKNSLSDDQLAILDNEELNQRERREALRATFTQDQLDLLDVHKTNVQSLKDSFRESLTDEQKQKLRQRRQRKQRLKEKKQQLNKKRR